jgi:phage baseplate assembly protein W
MRAFQITNGDLALGPRGYAEVVGLAKIQQDLGMAVLTPYGSDRFHPTWGCVLESQIGTAQGALTEGLVSAEITRVVQNYMQVQSNTLQIAQSNGYVSPYGNEDLVTGITGITTQSIYDMVQVICTVTTAANVNATINASVSPNGVTGTVS